MEENKQTSDEIRKTELIKEIFESENTKEILMLIKEKLKAQADMTTEETKTSFKTFFIERGIYFFIVLISFTAIILCAINDIIDGTVTGTLIGTIIGYTLAKASKTVSNE